MPLAEVPSKLVPSLAVDNGEVLLFPWLPIPATDGTASVSSSNSVWSSAMTALSMDAISPKSASMSGWLCTSARRIFKDVAKPSVRSLRLEGLP